MRRWRNLRLRRGRYFMPPLVGAAAAGPQALPPSMIDQAGMRPRRLYIRRGRYFVGPLFPPAPQALPPALLDIAGPRPRRLYIRRGRYFMPPLVGATPPGPQALPPSLLDISGPRPRRPFMRRGQFINGPMFPPAPQALPPMLISQSGLRPRRLYIRRGRYFQYLVPPTPPGPQALPPALLDIAGPRPRRLYIRRGRYFQYLVPPVVVPAVPPVTSAIVPAAGTPVWQFVGGPAVGGHTMSFTAAKNRKLTVRLNAPSEASFDIDGRNPQAIGVADLQTDLHVLYTPASGPPTQIVYRGRIGATTDMLDDRSHTVTVSSLDYRELLRRRILYSTNQLTWSNTDEADIAWGLVQQTQGMPGGNIGISRGVGHPMGFQQTRTYVAGDSIGDKIIELGSVQNGFEWDVTPSTSASLNLDLWQIGGRGNDRGVVLEYGGLVTAVQRETNPADYANAIRVTGDNVGTGPTPQELSAADIATRQEGRWDKAFTAPLITTLAALQSYAQWKIVDASVFMPAYTLTLRRGAWRGPNHIWLGDLVTVVVKSGRLAIGGVRYRVQEISIEIPEDGQEIVKVTAGRAPSNYGRWPAMIDRRLTDLERR